MNAKDWRDLSDVDRDALEKLRRELRRTVGGDNEIVLELLEVRPEVTEVSIDPSGRVFYFARREWVATEVFFSPEQREDILRTLAKLADQRYMRECQVVECAMPFYNARFTGLGPAISHRGATLLWRKHASEAFTLESYVATGRISELHATALERAVVSRKTIGVIGPTNSGKSAFMSALAGKIPASERVGLIEQLPELQVPRENCVALKEDEIAGADSAFLAIRPTRLTLDRLIVGEARDGSAYPLMKVMTMGLQGCLIGYHGESVRDGLDRYADLCEEWPKAPSREVIYRQIARAFRIAVFMEATYIRDVARIGPFLKGEWSLVPV